MRKITIVLAVVGAALASGACGGDAGTGASPSTPASASPTEKIASTQQYAGVVNSSIKSMRETWASYEDQCIVRENRVSCGLVPLTLEIEAQTLVIKLDGAGNPSGGTFIGKPPSEIEKLVHDTRAAAQGVDDAIDIKEGETPHPGDVLSSMSPLLTLFDAWDPYI